MEGKRGMSYCLRLQEHFHPLFPGFVMSQDVLAFINSSILAIQHLTTKPASELLFRARSKPGAALFVGAAIWIVFSSLRRRNAPPGPPRLPLLGNIFQVPLQLQFIPFTEWSKQYGMYHPYSSYLHGLQLIVCRPNFLT